MLRKELAYCKSISSPAITCRRSFLRPITETLIGVLSFILLDKNPEMEALLFFLDNISWFHPSPHLWSWVCLNKHDTVEKGKTETQLQNVRFCTAKDQECFTCTQISKCNAVLLKSILGFIFAHYFVLCWFQDVNSPKSFVVFPIEVSEEKEKSLTCSCCCAGTLSV